MSVKIKNIFFLYFIYLYTYTHTLGFCFLTCTNAFTLTPSYIHCNYHVIFSPDLLWCSFKHLKLSMFLCPHWQIFYSCPMLSLLLNMPVAHAHTNTLLCPAFTEAGTKHSLIMVINLTVASKAQNRQMHLQQSTFLHSNLHLSS